MYVRALWLMLTLAVLVCAGTPGRAQQSSSAVLWRVPAMGTAPLPELMDRGLLPVEQGTAMRPQLALLELATGKVRWSVPVPAAPDALNATDDSVLVSTTGFWGAVDAKDGSIRWGQNSFSGVDAPTPDDARAWMSGEVPGWQPIANAFLVRGGLVCCSQGGKVYALNPATGEVQWQAAAGFAVTAPLTPLDDRVLVGTTDAVGAFDAKSGELKWAQRVGIVHSITVAEGEVYVCHVDKLSRLDAADGRILWTQQLPGGALMALDVVPGKIVALLGKGVRVLKRDTGEMLWQATTAGLETVLLNGRLLYRTPDMNCVHAQNLADLSVAWEVECHPQESIHLVGLGKAVAVVGPTGVTALDQETGTPVWTWQADPGDMVEPGVCAQDQRVLCLCTNKMLVCLRPTDGSLLLAVSGDYWNVSGMTLHGDRVYILVGGMPEGLLEAVALPVKTGEATVPQQPATGTDKGKAGTQ